MDAGKRILLLGGTTLHPLIKTWRNKLSPVPSASYFKSLNKLFLTLGDSQLALFDYFAYYATPYQQNAQVPIITTSGSNITEVNSPTWTAGQGYTGNGTTMYKNLNWNPSTNGVKFLQNSASQGSYITTNTAAGSKIELGHRNGVAKFSSVAARFTGDIIACPTNSELTGIAGGTNTDARGLISGQRTVSTSYSSLKNGVVIDSDTNNSVAPFNANYFSLARNFDGAAELFSDRRKAMDFMGGGGINHLLLYNANQVFATEQGFNV
jgi:hypothetical protein